MGESGIAPPGARDALPTLPNGAPPDGELPSRLQRPFKVIAFDWDGTAVMSRREDTTRLRDSVDMLLRLDVVIMIISGTKLSNIDLWLSAMMRGAQLHNLFISTNRGSEVYGFDALSRPVLLWQRRASCDEDRLLTEVIDAVRDAVVARTGLEVGVVYDRMSRRKLDLVPLPEWRDPPRSAIGEVWQVVEARLRGAGLSRGLRGVLELVERAARQKGLKGARLTTDAKQVEVGLTDKSDAMDWLMRELARRRNVSAEDILVAGDEFGSIAGLCGSDYRMVTVPARGATFVSVGPEPGGTPPEVVHLGGGPARFRTLLACQTALHERHRPMPERPVGGLGRARRAGAHKGPVSAPGP